MDKAIEDQRAAIKRDTGNDALWEKLHELETLKFGSPVTTRKPVQPKAATVEVMDQPNRTIGELPPERLAEMGRLLRQSVDNPQP